MDILSNLMGLLGGGGDKPVPGRLSEQDLERLAYEARANQDYDKAARIQEVRKMRGMEAPASPPQQQPQRPQQQSGPSLSDIPAEIGRQRQALLDALIPQGKRGK